MNRVIQRVNVNKLNCGVNVKSSEGTSLALDFYGTIVTFVGALDYSFLSPTVRLSLGYYT
ncbi:MAG: hypothetical protein IPM48_07800 [Saprospiraceae bacterium]|nr:hypothetical protein [Saprospiraceae bacterium]